MNDFRSIVVAVLVALNIHCLFWYLVKGAANSVSKD